MAERLENKVALVTGAGGGIGRGIAVRFAAEGAKVGVLDILEDGVRETVAIIQSCGGQAYELPCNLREPEQVKNAVTTLNQAFGNSHRTEKETETNHENHGNRILTMG